MGPRDEDSALSLFLATRSRWKRMRVILNPTFSTAKLRDISLLVNTCVDRLVEVLNKANETKEILISEYEYKM